MFSFFLYSSEDDYIMSLSGLNNLNGYEAKEFENINELISEYLRLKQRSENVHSLKKTRLDELGKKISNLTKKIDSLNVQLSHSEESGKLKFV